MSSVLSVEYSQDSVRGESTSAVLCRAGLRRTQSRVRLGRRCGVSEPSAARRWKPSLAGSHALTRSTSENSSAVGTPRGYRPRRRSRMRSRFRCTNSFATSDGTALTCGANPFRYWPTMTEVELPSFGFDQGGVVAPAVGLVNQRSYDVVFDPVVGPDSEPERPHPNVQVELEESSPVGNDFLRQLRPPPSRR